MYATCDFLHSWGDVFDRVGVMTYRVDVMASRNGFQVRYRACVVIHTVCDIIYRGYDVINIVGAVT